MAHTVQGQVQVGVVDTVLFERREAALRAFNSASWAYFNGLGSNDEYIRRGTPTGQASSRLAEIEVEMRRQAQLFKSLDRRIKREIGGGR